MKVNERPRPGATGSGRFVSIGCLIAFFLLITCLLSPEVPAGVKIVPSGNSLTVFATFTDCRECCDDFCSPSCIISWYGGQAWYSAVKLDGSSSGGGCDSGDSYTATCGTFVASWDDIVYVRGRAHVCSEYEYDTQYIDYFDRCENKHPTDSAVNVLTGNLSHSPQVGPLAINYDSLGTMSPLGRGWSHAYSRRIRQAPYNGPTVLLQTSWRDRIRFERGSDGLFHSASPRDRSVLTKNPDLTWTRSEPNGTVSTYGADGYLRTVTDSNGNVTRLTYSGFNLRTITDPVGRTIQITTNSSGRITAVKDYAGNSYTFTYTTVPTYGDLLTRITDPLGNAWMFTYTSDGKMRTKTDPSGSAVTYTYTAGGTVQKVEDPEGASMEFRYAPSPISCGPSGSPCNIEPESIAEVTAKDGGIWKYHYRTGEHVPYKVTDPQGNTKTYQYDGSGNLIGSNDDPSSDGTTYTYDTNGNMLTMTDAMGAVTRYTYNALNKPLTMTDPLGNVTTYTNDAKGNMLTMTDPTGNITTYEYYPSGKVKTVRNPLNQVTAFTYDQYNNPATVTDPAGGITRFTHDILGNMLTRTDPMGNVSRYEYNALNQVVRMTDAQGHVTTYSYDPKGNLTTATDANGNITRYEYNYRGQTTKVIDPLGGTTNYTYGSMGCTTGCGGGSDKLTSITDPAGNTTTYTYDTAGRLIKETDPEGHETLFTYDPAGNVASKTDANGVTVTYAYDPVKRLTQATYPDPTQNVSYTYNAPGKVLSVTDPSGTTTYAYDSIGSPLSETKAIDGDNYTTSYSYNAAGSLTSITYPGGRTTSYNYDQVGRIASVTESKNGTTRNVISGITYNANSLVSQMTHGNGIVTSKTYDPLNALSSLQIGPHKHLTYTRDAIGNITAITDQLDPAKTKSFVYDPLYRLTQAIGPWETLQYGYDPVGNRTTESMNTSTTSYAYTANKLTSSTGSKTFAFAYDNNGNTVMENQRQFVYNQNQRLIRALEGTTVLGEYVYNAKGQRVKKTAGGQTTLYHYDLQGNLIAESTADGTIRTEYVYLNGQPIGKIEGNNLSYYHTDHLGTPMIMTDTAGAKVWEGEFLPFGEPLSITGTETNNLRFPGQYHDQETGLDQNWHREYKPEIGRYMSVDPILTPGNPYVPFMMPALLKKPAMLHAYNYVENNPVNKRDPLGLMSCGGCNLNDCLNACTAGGVALRNFCRSLPDPRLRAGCWALEFVGENVCKGWCYWNCR